jgi:lysophospholipid acyltransferase
MCWFMYGFEILHIIGTSVACYLILTMMSPKISHQVVFVFMLGYVFAAHVYRWYNDYMGWKMDFTGTQMMLTIKMTMMAFNVHDGSEKADVRVVAR